MHAEVHLKSGNCQLIRDVYAYDTDNGFVHIHTPDKTVLFPAERIAGIVIVN